MSPVADARSWADHVRRVEDAGFSTLLLSDHTERSPLGPIPAMAHAAALADRLRVGSLVLNNDFRHPAILAKELATIDLLTGGRLEIGIGAGWMRDEFEALGVDFEGRGRRTDDFMHLLREVWTGSVRASSTASYVVGRDVYSEPRPAHDVELIVGGNTKAALRRAGRQVSACR